MAYFRATGVLNLEHTFKVELQDFPGGPVVKTLHFHSRGHGFDPWLGKFCMLCGAA